jgi:hypothetical protein
MTGDRSRATAAVPVGEPRLRDEIVAGGLAALPVTW